MDFENIAFDQPEDGIAVVTLSRPERLNTLTKPLFDELEAAQLLGALVVTDRERPQQEGGKDVDRHDPLVEAERHDRAPRPVRVGRHLRQSRAGQARQERRQGGKAPPTGPEPPQELPLTTLVERAELEVVAPHVPEHFAVGRLAGEHRHGADRRTGQRRRRGDRFARKQLCASHLGVWDPRMAHR